MKNLKPWEIVTETLEILWLPKKDVRFWRIIYDSCIVKDICITIIRNNIRLFLWQSPSCCLCLYVFFYKNIESYCQRILHLFYISCSDFSQCLQFLLFYAFNMYKLWLIHLSLKNANLRFESDKELGSKPAQHRQPIIWAFKKTADGKNCTKNSPIGYFDSSQATWSICDSSCETCKEFLY